MSVNKYNHTTGQLEPLSQNRIWIGTEAEMRAEKTAGTLPTDAILYITDDEDEIVVQDEINDIVNVYGSKNLLPNYAPDTTTSNNVTFTKQSDGTMVLTTSAAASAYTTVGLYSNAYPAIQNKSGLIVSAMGNGIALRVADQDGTWYGSSNKEILVPAGKNIITAALAVQQGATFNGTVAKPMLRAASITDNTYVPYVMTNKELTNNAIMKKLQRFTSTSSANDLSNYFKKAPNISVFDFSIGGAAITYGGVTFPEYTYWHIYKDTAGSAGYGGIGFSYNSSKVYHLKGGYSDGDLVNGVITTII